MWINGPDSMYYNSWIYMLHVSSNMLGNILSGIIYGFNE